MKELLAKYDIPAPRYTSYPTVPYWDNSPTTQEWTASINHCLIKENTSWSMYIHIPFCESLCTFCGCNTVITRDHKRENIYINQLLSEWEMYIQNCPDLKSRPLKELHFGGGTPTFFSPENLKKLIKGIFKDCTLSNNFEGSIEVDPRRTTKKHLAILKPLGFHRVSMGVQDFDLEVQKLINRIQPEKTTKDLTSAARKIGYTSVNYDLIYGLPKQDISKIKHLVKTTIKHRPDRVALYSFALVPWIKPAHRIFKDEDLPVGAEKRELYEVSRKKLIDAGYIEIGMDHFALKSDSLYKSLEEGKLHRNFMGYTATRTDLLLGIGVSSISETPDMFHQNEKKLIVYEREILKKNIPTFRGHKLTSQDKVYRELILNLMTKWKVELTQADKTDLEIYLNQAIKDGFIHFKGLSLEVLKKGRPFLRNICMGLDKRLRLKNPTRKVFSQSI